MEAEAEAGEARLPEETYVGNWFAWKRAARNDRNDRGSGPVKDGRESE